MEEELVKRNTDCVYFLASPLTCKKGIDCEFRHSNIARLNPKECWYWLAGNCLNPTCAFRHPPLDGHGGSPSESSPPSVTTNKTGVPCYFYSNGFCNKGDKCSFLHDDTDGNASNGKSSKTASACNEALALTSENEAAAGNGALARISESKAPAGNEALARTSENKAPAGNDALALNSETKASVGNDTISAPRITHFNPSETASKATVGTRFQHKENLSYFEQRVQRDVPQKSVYTQISMSGDEEAGEIRSDSLPEDSSIHAKSHSWTDQSSEDEDDDLVPEERWESSPGFDVLVDGKSDNLGCDDDQYFPTLHGEHWELNSRFLGYDFENPDEYVPEYPDAKLLHDRDMYNDCLDTRIIFGNQGPIPVYTKERMSDSMFSSKRKHMPRELFDGDEDFLDLRDRLRRRRVTDGPSINGLSRRHESLGLFGRPQRHGLGRQLHGRLASLMGKNTYESLRGNGACFNGGTQRGSLGHAQEYRSRKHHKERRQAKQQFPLFEISKKPFPREKRSARQPTTFTGPKTLAQIREEKRKAEENGGRIGIPKRARRTTVDFQGPKPLNEILKEKGKIPD